MFQPGFRASPVERMRMNRRTLGRLAAAVFAGSLFAGLAPFAFAADEAPDAFIKRLSDDVLGTIRSDKAVQSGNVERIMAVVDAKIMPNVNFTRMTASAVGPAWREATADTALEYPAEIRRYALGEMVLRRQEATEKPEV